MHFCIMSQCICVCVCDRVKALPKLVTNSPENFAAWPKKSNLGAEPSDHADHICKLRALLCHELSPIFQARCFDTRSPCPHVGVAIERATATSKLTAPLCAGEAKPQTLTLAHTRTRHTHNHICSCTVTVQHSYAPCVCGCIVCQQPAWIYLLLILPTKWLGIANFISVCVHVCNVESFIPLLPDNCSLRCAYATLSLAWPVFASGGLSACMIHFIVGPFKLLPHKDW